MAVRVLGKVLPVESVKTGDEIRSCSHSSQTTSYRMLHFARKALFPIVRHTKMSSVFGMGWSMNFRDLKDRQMSKVRASSHDYPHVEKIKNLCEQNFEGVRQTTSNWIVRIPNEGTSVIKYRSLTLITIIFY